MAMLDWLPWGTFFYSKFWNENGQNVKCARFSIPHSYSGMDRMPFHSFCSQGQNEQNVANAFRTNHSYSRMVDKKTCPWFHMLVITMSSVFAIVTKQIQKPWTLCFDFVILIVQWPSDKRSKTASHKANYCCSSLSFHLASDLLFPHITITSQK